MRFDAGYIVLSQQCGIFGCRPLANQTTKSNELANPEQESARRYQTNLLFNSVSLGAASAGREARRHVSEKCTVPNSSYCGRLPAYLLFFKQLEDVVCVTNDGHLLFQHRLQHGKPVTYLRNTETTRQC